MIKTLNTTIKQDRTAYKIPRSVQDVIPIQRIFADGIFQFGTKYSRTLRFSDINYAIASKEDKTAMFLGYSELLNALDSGSTTKLTICNKQVNRQAFEDTVLLPQRGDSLDGFVDWTFYNATNGAYLPGRGGGAASQHGYCTNIAWSDALPGDLVFYADDSHVGIVCGYDSVGNLLVIHCSGGQNGVVVTGREGFAVAARPDLFTD